jgi:uncharacterized protein
MRILIDINHPAHVHYFKNLIKIMEKNGHTFIITNRDQKIINELLDAYCIKHTIRNKRPEKNSYFASIFYILKAILFIHKSLKNEKIDIFLGFASIPCSFLSFVHRKPSIIIDDTEHNKVNHLLYKHFCSVIITPFYFKKNMGSKQFYFKAFVEQLYLHSKYFNNRIENLNLSNEFAQPYVLVRYIAYTAGHDHSVSDKLTLEEKKAMVQKLSEKIRVFVSIENNTEDDYFNQYAINLKPEQMHDLIANATLLITEGATMASEAGVLGVNYYYINPLKVGNVNEQCIKYPNAHQCNGRKLLENINKLRYIKANSKEIRTQIENSTINPTEYLIWFIENYPKSYKILKENPDYQF